jgi:hypothetical protein
VCIQACLLTAWIRSGYWVTSDAQNFLEIKKNKEESLFATETTFVVRMKKKEVSGWNMDSTLQHNLFP